MGNFKNKLIFFALGGVGYAIIELLWRRKTHWTMVMAGGLCFVFVSEIAKNNKNKSLLFKAALGSLAVTSVELAFGIVFNRIMKMNVWDYSDEAFNLLGQICPLFTIFWWALAMIFVPVADAINDALEQPSVQHRSA